MMRPVDELTREVLAAIDVVAFDVDDTITDHGVLTSRSLATMERLRSVGVRLVAITGRPLGWAQAWFAQWPIDLAIGENGAGWFFRGPRGVESRLYLDDASHVAAARERAFAIGRDVAPEIPIPRDGTARYVDVAFDIGETWTADPARVDALESALREGGFATVRSTVHLHAACGDWDKWKGLVRAYPDAFRAPLDGAALERLVFIGDSANDQPLFRALPLTVGVANVADNDLAVPPRFVTSGRCSAGFAELGDMIAGARGGS